jgi:hypothetical protein
MVVAVRGLGPGVSAAKNTDFFILGIANPETQYPKRKYCGQGSQRWL